MDELQANLGSAPALDLSEEALRQREAFNFALFQHNPAPSVVVDPDGCVIKSNLARRKQAAPLPVLGEPLYSSDGDSGERELSEALFKCIRSSSVLSFPERQVGRRIFSITMCPLPEGAIVITEDITDRKLAEERLIQAQKLASIGTLVTGVAHEISNPNNIMLLNARALRETWEGLLPVLDEYCREHGEFRVGRQAFSAVREEAAELLDGVANAAERIKRLTDELKTFARKEKTPDFHPVDLNKVVESATALLAPVLRKATQSFSTSLQPGLPLVRGSAQRLEQVVVNLLTNACEALRSRQDTIELETGYDAQRGRVCVRVRDTGVGLPSNALAQIKDPFFTTKHDTGGTGLGLSICQSIVESHRGELTFESQPDHGTTAILSLPVLASAAGGGDKPERAS
jgi:signal transduction histidine kinase